MGLKIIKDDPAFKNTFAIKEDDFDHRAIAETIMDVIEDQDNTPLTIGLFGGWGVGKTSIINILKFKIKDKAKYKYIYFNAWKYSEDSFRREFLLAIAKNFKVSKHKIERLKRLNHSDAINSKFSFSSFKVDWYSFLKFIQTILICGVVYYFLSFKGLIGKMDQIPAAIFATIIGVINLILPRIEQILKIDNITDHKLIYPEQFYSEFKKIIKKKCSATICRPKITPVIVIDDLDRCNPDTIRTILSTLKSFLSHKDCIFIVPIDDSAVVQILSNANKNVGYEQLRKYFSVSIRIPEIHTEDIIEFARKATVEYKIDSDVIWIGALGYCNDARKMKHFINLYILKYSIASKRKDSGYLSDTDIDTLAFKMQLAKVCVLEYQFPEVFQFLSQYPHRYDLMTEAASNGSEIIDKQDLQNIYPSCENTKQLWAKFPGLRIFLNRTNNTSLSDFELLSKLKVTFGEKQASAFSNLLYKYILRDVNVEHFEDVLTDLYVTEHGEQIVHALDKRLSCGVPPVVRQVFDLGIYILEKNILPSVHNDNLYISLVNAYCYETFEDFRKVTIQQIRLLIDKLEILSSNKNRLVGKIQRNYISTGSLEEVLTILTHQSYGLLLKTKDDFSRNINDRIIRIWSDLDKSEPDRKVKFLEVLNNVTLTKAQRLEYGVQIPHQDMIDTILIYLQGGEQVTDDLNKISANIILNIQSSINFNPELIARISKMLENIFIQELQKQQYETTILKYAISLSLAEHIKLESDSAWQIAQQINTYARTLPNYTEEFHGEMLRIFIKCYHANIDENRRKDLEHYYSNYLLELPFAIIKQQFEIIKSPYYSQIEGISNFKSSLIHNLISKLRINDNDFPDLTEEIATFCLEYKSEIFSNTEIQDFVINVIRSDSYNIHRKLKDVVATEFQQCTEEQRVKYLSILIGTDRLESQAIEKDIRYFLIDLFFIGLDNLSIENAQTFCEYIIQCLYNDDLIVQGKFRVKRDEIIDKFGTSFIINKYSEVLSHILDIKKPFSSLIKFEDSVNFCEQYKSELNPELENLIAQKIIDNTSDINVDLKQQYIILLKMGYWLTTQPENHSKLEDSLFEVMTTISDMDILKEAKKLYNELKNKGIIEKKKRNKSGEKE